MGAQPDHTLETIRLDSGPAAAKLLQDDEVDLVLYTCLTVNNVPWVRSHPCLKSGFSTVAL